MSKYTVVHCKIINGVCRAKKLRRHAHIVQCATPSNLPIFTAALDTDSSGARVLPRLTGNNAGPGQFSQPVSNALNTSYPDLDRIRDSTIMCENDLYEDECGTDSEIRHINSDSSSEDIARNENYDEVRLGGNEVQHNYLYAEVKRPGLGRPAMHEAL